MALGWLYYCLPRKFGRTMKNKTDFKVGDKIIDFGQVYEIFKVEEKENADGEKEKVICFKPFFETNHNKSLICSIPVESIGLTHIRKPISKERSKALLKELSEEPETRKPINIKAVKDVLNQDDLPRTVEVLKGMWFDKNDELTSSTKAKKDIFAFAVMRIAEEVAFVENISVPEAKERIKKALEKLKI